MLYAALTFWLLVVVLTARGVHVLWSGMVKPKTLNTVLLPGTLVAQLGHVIGLLVTGATISNTTLYGDDESRAPETTPNPKPKIPVVGPVIIGLLPLLACAAAIYVVARCLAGPVMADFNAGAAGPVLPTTMAGIWQLLRDQITAVESIVSAIAAADYGSWRTWLFLYLVICLTVRIAPPPGNLRGAMGAILVLGVVTATVSSLVDVADARVRSAWSILNLTIAILFFLLFVSLLVRGAVGLVKLFWNEGTPT
jgi:hypothetical protein